MCNVDTVDVTDRYVIVRADTLDDLCALSERAVTELNAIRPCDQLADALNGAVAEVRTHSLYDH